MAPVTRKCPNPKCNRILDRVVYTMLQAFPNKYEVKNDAIPVLAFECPHCDVLLSVHLDVKP